MNKKSWATFRAGERVWSLVLGEWVTLREPSKGWLSDGRWLYSESGIVHGLPVPYPLLFRGEVRPEDWPQPDSTHALQPQPGVSKGSQSTLELQKSLSEVE